MNTLEQNIKSSISTKNRFLNADNITLIKNISNLAVKTLQNQNSIIFCGNGGSAADALHLSAELSGRYYINRPALKSFALGTNISSITAISNDFGFQQLFARELEALGSKNDLLFAMSTSGNSENVINCILKAKEMNIKTVGFTGHDGGKMKNLCDYLVSVPSNDVPRIQELHMLIGHTICENIEKTLFNQQS